MATDPRPLLGQRVALRHRVSGTGSRPLRSDAVGDLDHDATRWVVHTAKGPVAVDPEDVVAVRAVPPPRPRRAPLAAVEQVERVCDAAWPSPVTAWLGGWLLRAGARVNARTSSASALGDPGMPVAEALVEVQRFAAEHGIAPRVQVSRSTPWETQIERAGWVPDEHEPVSVRTVRVAELTGPEDHPGVEIAAAPTPAWWQLVAGTEHPDEDTRAVLAGGTVGFGLARAGDQAVGAVRVALVDRWLHLARLAVEPEWRRRGLGRALTGAAAAWGRQHGAREAVLQVMPGNIAADRLYSSLGFSEHHSYRYWSPGVSARQPAEQVGSRSSG